MLPEKTREDQSAAEGHDSEGYGEVDESAAAERDGEENHGDGNEDAGHLEANETAFGRAAKAHVGAWEQRGGDGDRGDKPDVHGLPPSCLVSVETGLRSS